MSPLATFFSIVNQFENSHRFIDRGFVLSAPALEYKGRAFAFCRDGEIVVRLRGCDPGSLGIRAFRSCHPFKNSQSLPAWFQIPYYYQSDWNTVALKALESVKEEVDS